MTEYITTAEAGLRLGVSDRRVRAMIKAGRLPSKSVGGIHLIDPADLTAVKDRPPGWRKGRPRGKKTGPKNSENNSE